MARKTLEFPAAQQKTSGKNASPPEGLQSFQVAQASQVAVEPQKRVELDDAMFDAICDQLANGKTLLQICRDDGMPGASTVRRWVQRGSKETRAKYASARELGIETLADEIVEIADDSSQDEKEIENGRGETYTVMNREFAERSKIRIDARKWMLSKLAAHTYGDKIEHSGEIKGGGTVFTLHIGEGSKEVKSVEEERPTLTLKKSADEIIGENL